MEIVRPTTSKKIKVVDDENKGCTKVYPALTTVRRTLRKQSSLIH
jgi:hypothetical protein